MNLPDFERLGNPGWNWNNFQKFVSRTEGFVEPSKEVQKLYNLNYDDWQIGREGQNLTGISGQSPLNSPIGYRPTSCLTSWYNC